MSLAARFEHRPELFDLLTALSAADQQLSVALSAVALDPSLYAAQRSTLDALHATRSSAAELLGLAYLRALRQAVDAPSSPDAAPAHAEPEVDRASGTQPPRARAEPTSEPPPPPTEQQRRSRDTDALRTLLQHSGWPSRNDAADDLERLAKNTDPSNFDRWDRLSREGQRRWLEYLTAWARAASEHQARDRRSKAVFSHLTTYSRQRTSGHVNGLAVDHSPAGRSWLADAEAFAVAINPRRHGDAGPPSPAAKQQATTSAPRHSAEERAPRSAPPPPDWSFWDHVRNKRGVLFGGAQREGRRRVLQEEFAFASLEWIESGKHRLVQSLCDRIRGGSVDVLLITKRAGHREVDALRAAAESGRTLTVMVRSGYGIGQVRDGIERAARARARSM